MRLWLLIFFLFAGTLYADGDRSIPPVKQGGNTINLMREIRRLSENVLPRAGGDRLFYRDIKNERIGIGTVSPSSPLDVFNNTTTNGTSGATFSRGSSKLSSENNDATVEIWTDGEFTRPGLNIVSDNSNYTEAPVILMENAQPPSEVGGNGIAMAFYGGGYQIGILGYSWTGATTDTAKAQVYLASGGESVPVAQIRGAGSPGRAYSLFGPPSLHNAGSTVHVASDSGDVDSGIRLEMGQATYRYNLFISSPTNTGDLYIRDTDQSGFGLKMNHGAQSVQIKGSTTSETTCSDCYGAELTTTTIIFSNVAATSQYGNVVSMSLTPGVWNLGGNVVMTANGATISSSTVAISINSGNTTTDHVETVNQLPYRPAVSGADITLSIPRYRLSLASTTTVYLKTRADYSVATPQAKGHLYAERAH